MAPRAAQIDLQSIRSIVCSASSRPVTAKEQAVLLELCDALEERSSGLPKVADIVRPATAAIRRSGVFERATLRGADLLEELNQAILRLEKLESGQM
jgi:hypothetical protein